MANDRSTALLKLMRRQDTQTGLGLRIIKVSSASPLTLTFEGSNLALDQELFEIPEDFKPLAKGQRFFTLPILGQYASQRWGLIEKIK
ncbi:hypothetical protein ABE094_21450 [Bacillus inaquosorum]|uniref:hypothetical protein n=1 Tax=Bacillaceae TaxID=186817 RepID=UPI003D20AAE2